MSSFPIDPYLKDIIHCVDELGTVIVKAEPGAGKTTRIPAELIRTKDCNVLVIEPRRVAAKLPATFIAEQLGEKVGESVGYKVRFDQKVSKNTRLTFMTDGMAVKHLLNPTFLDDIDYVIFDEFHERSLNTDLALALFENYRALNGNTSCRLIVMSATLDISELAMNYDRVETFDIKGRMFPVDQSYLPCQDRERTEEHVARAVNRTLKLGLSDGNILIFLTGKADITKTVSHLTSKFPDMEVIPFYSEIANKSMTKIKATPEKRKIICSTNVAETSVTLPKVRAVIDLGQQFEQFFAPWNGLPFIRRKKISQDSAIQRAGRAGRVSEGICLRLYSESDFYSRDRFNSPEIERADLSSFLLEGMIGSGASVIEDFLGNLSFVTPPPEASLNTAISCLKLIGFMDSAGKLTAKALDAKNYPVHPRLAAMILHGIEISDSATAILLAAIIETGGVISRKSESKIFHNSDFELELDYITKYLIKKSNADYDSSGMRVNTSSLRLVCELAYRLGLKDTDLSQIKVQNINNLLLRAFPDRVARVLPKFKQKQDQAAKKGELFRGGQYAFALGKSANLPKTSGVQGHNLLIAPIALELTERGKKQIFLDMVSAISSEELIDVSFENGMITQSSDVEQRKSGDFVKKEILKYGEITIKESILLLSEGEVHTAIVDALKSNFPSGFSDVDYYNQYVNKLKAIHKLGVEHSLPMFEGEFLDIALDVIAEGKKSIDDVYETSLRQYISELVSYEDLCLMDDICPSQIKLSNGSKLPVIWDEDGSPVISAKLQQFYGISEPIKVGSMNVLARIVILGPNDRPIQVTGDICSFFDSGYEILAKEMKRRYPKHYWPEKPKSAKPIILKRHALG